MPVAFLTQTTEAARASPAANTHVDNVPNIAALKSTLRINPHFAIGLATPNHTYPLAIGRGYSALYKMRRDRLVPSGPSF